jgi:hypothetical protein
MSRSPEGRRLRSFRLEEIPTPLRLRAARQLARMNAPPSDAVRGTDRLFARLLADQRAGGDTGDPDVIHRVAEHPSDKVYWVTAAAWERVMGAQ